MKPVTSVTAATIGPKGWLMEEATVPSALVYEVVSVAAAAPTVAVAGMADGGDQARRIDRDGVVHGVGADRGGGRLRQLHASRQGSDGDNGGRSGCKGKHGVLLGECESGYWFRLFVFNEPA